MANCAINILAKKENTQKLVKFFYKKAKTGKKGTTAQNLINAIEDYLAKKRIIADIKYYGIRFVEKNYQSPVPIDICRELQNGSSIILNIGLYSCQNGVFTRNGGHYVNANSCAGGKILISDPYSPKSPFYIELKPNRAPKIINPKDNEKYSGKDYEYFVITPHFEYLEPDETAILNGIIKIYPFFL